MASRPVALFADTLLGLRETSHLILQGDARAALGLVADASVHLIVTSPPYWTLKRYQDAPGQLDHIEDYEAFLAELAKVWQEVYRVLVPGGRLPQT